MDGPRDYILNEVRKKKTNTILRSLICGILKYNSNELIYKAETDSQTQRTNMVAKGIGLWKKMIRVLRFRCKVLYTE